MASVGAIDERVVAPTAAELLLAASSSNTAYVTVDCVVRMIEDFHTYTRDVATYIASLSPVPSFADVAYTGNPSGCASVLDDGFARRMLTAPVLAYPACRSKYSLLSAVDELGITMSRHDNFLSSMPDFMPLKGVTVVTRRASQRAEIDELRYVLMW